MEILDVEVAQDHSDGISKTKKPILGLAELIWNSADADAAEVTVRLNRNSPNAINTIDVIEQRTRNHGANRTAASATLRRPSTAFSTTL
jgi:hypothetical protein